MGVRGEQRGELVLPERGHVLLAQGVEQALLPDEPGALPGALLLGRPGWRSRPRGPPGPGPSPGRCPGRAGSRPRSTRRSTARRRAVPGRAGSAPARAALSDPGRALARRLPHRVAVAHRVGERALQLGRHLWQPEQHLLLDHGQEDVGEVEPAGALVPAVVAGDAAEEIVAGEHLLDEAFPQHADEAARGVAHHVAVGAGAGAGAALDAAQQRRPSGVASRPSSVRSGVSGTVAVAIGHSLSWWSRPRCRRRGGLGTGLLCRAAPGRRGRVAISAARAANGSRSARAVESAPCGGGQLWAASTGRLLPTSTGTASITRAPIAPST